jgi:hypothetical protein
MDLKNRTFYDFIGIYWTFFFDYFGLFALDSTHGAELRDDQARTFSDTTTDYCQPLSTLD